MFRYADPDLCPGCRAHLPYAATACPDCRLPLTGTLPDQLFRALTHADGLLARLAESREPVPAEPDAVPEGPSLQYDGPPAPRPGRGLSAASVPRILLGLGATCLLVASLVFLAVTWAALGVGGRTAVLVVLTAATAGTAGWLARRALRAGAEAFATVGLGLLGLDLVGAEDAGWLGPIGDAWFLVLAGGVVATAGLAGAYLARRTPARELVSGQAFAVLGAAAAGIGATALPGADGDLMLLVATVGTGAVAAGAARAGLRWAAAGTGAVAASWWLLLAWSGVLAGDPATVAHVWGDLAIWPALAAVAVTAAVAAVPTLPQASRVGTASLAVALGTFCATVVAWDESGTVLSLVQLAVVGAAVAAAAVLRRPWRWVAVAPAAVAGLLLAGTATRLAGTALADLLGHGLWSQPAGLVLSPPAMPWSWPVLLPAGTAAALAAGWVALRCLDERLTRGLPGAGAVAVLATGALVPALYGAPLWAAVTVLLLVVLGLLGNAMTGPGVTALLGTAVLAPVTLGAALANDWLTAVVLGVTTLVAGMASWRGTAEPAVAGDLVLPLSLGGLLWTGLHLAGVEPTWRTVAVLVAVGALVIARPTPARELPAAATGSVAVAFAVLTPAGLEQAWLAALLTLAGVLVGLSALVHPSRRRLGWAATGLFALAQWTRLEQLGVETVEAYTLPLAVVLLAVGVVRLVATDLSSHRAFGAGLGLALVPTLLQVLLDPVSQRAVLLGAGCLLLVGVGVQRRWSAPLLAGAATGTLVVLREAAHAEVLPQWMVIGLVGTVLIVVGVTWEQRLADLRTAGAYLRRLR
jgi:hypothetical protein